uniref:Uncharacterized protein n=1 Tax=Oryza brachyantha TaxID=4533 RepID=J3NBT4_ORYBR
MASTVVRITRLKDMSGALWDDQLCMIVLEEEHYMVYVKDHSKDAEFLNVPLENYVQMAIIFANGQATGRYAMASTEALGNPVDMADSGNVPMDVSNGDGIAARASGVGADSIGKRTVASAVGPSEEELAALHDLTGGSSGDRKRKRSVLNEGDIALITNMTESVNNVAAEIHATAYTEVHPDLCKSVMDLSGFTEDQLDLVLTFLTKDKAESLVFI